MDYDLGKLAGENRPYPEKAIESWPENPHSTANHQTADQQWQATTRRFSDLLARLAHFAESDNTTLARKVQKLDSDQSAHPSTFHAMLWQIVAHNSYHTGQIALLRRQFGAWPPRRGGDTW